MRTSTLLSTTAAVLLLGGGLALAQGKSDVSPERAPPAQRSAPAEKVAPPMNAGERKAPETTGAGSQNGAPSGLEPRRSGETKGTTGAGAGGEMKSSPADKDAGADKDMKRSGDAKTDDKRSTSGAASGAKTDSNRAAPDDKSKASDKSNTSDDKAAAGASDRNRSTTGQGAAAGAAKLSTEQRTKISTIIKEKKVAPAKLDISINVGTRVPPSVRFYPVPVEVVEVYPEWRGYDYIIVGGDILILEPDTHVIVAIIAA